MASKNQSEQSPQSSAQRGQPPEASRNDDSGSNCDDEDQQSAKQPPVDDTPQNTASASHDYESERTPLFPEDNDNASAASVPSDADVEGENHEEVVSPSASIPPYWSNSRLLEQQQQQQQKQQRNELRPSISGHARAVSSASAESVLPPGAITLQDNEREGDDDCDNLGEGGSGGRGDRNGRYPGGRRSNSSEVYGRDRNRACWARSVQVTDYVMVNGSTTNIGAFVVWIIKVETLNGARINIRKRYSEFDDLRRRLVQTFPGFEAAVPALPPKSVLKRFHPRFLEKRRAGLQYFLNCILLNPEFSGSPVLKEFLFS
ncbi:hypothetical protein VTI28DRAFT_10350 [Corynascus sepedonium]